MTTKPDKGRDRETLDRAGWTELGLDSGLWLIQCKKGIK